jgi:hypothetical protein
MSETFSGANAVFPPAGRDPDRRQTAPTCLTIADSNALDVAEGTIAFRFEASPP